MSTMSRLAALARRLGIQYNGNRDVYASAGYQRNPMFEDYLALYQRDPVAARIITLPVETTWREPPEIIEEGKPEGTPFTKAVAKLARGLKLWETCAKADTFAGLGQYAVLLLGTRDASPQVLATPVTGPQDLRYLEVYGERDAVIEQYVTALGDSRRGEVAVYTLHAGGEKNFPSQELRVHASRVLHIAEGTLFDRVHGRPRLASSLNLLADLLKVTASTGEAYWQGSNRTLQITLDPQAEFTEQQLTELTEQAAEMTHDLRRQFVAQGAKMSWEPAQVSPVKDIGDLYAQYLSVASGIPRRILFGNESGELASSTDQATFFGMIAERQKHFAEPQFVRALLDKLIMWRVLPLPDSGEYQVIWPSLFRQTELELADANLKRAQAVAALTPMGGDPLDLIEIDEDRNIWPVPKKAKPVTSSEPTPVPPEAGE